MEPNAPQFQHDCDRCEFLGRWRGKMTNNPGQTDWDFDLYYADHGGIWPIGTYIARFGNDGDEYISGIGETIFAWHPCLRAAAELWKARQT